MIGKNAPLTFPDLAYGMGLAWLILAVSLAITVGAWLFAKSHIERIVFERFDFQIAEVESAIQERMLAYEQVLRGGVALFAAAPRVTRQNWRIYVTKLNIEQNFPGILGIGFSRRILPAEKDAHVRQVRAEGFPDYDIWPKGQRPEYTSIVYLEPFNWRNRRAFGYDMFSEPVRRAAMERARDTGMTTVSGKITLMQETDSGVQAGFLMYLPVYRSGLPLDTVEQRRAALLGYVYSPFRMEDLLHGILSERAPAIHLEIFDGAEISEPAKMYNSNGAIHLSRASNRFNFVTTTTLDLFGHTWTLRFSPLPGFEAPLDKQTPRLVLACGVLISLMLFAVVWFLASRRRHALAAEEGLKRAILALEHAKFETESANQRLARANFKLQRLSQIDGLTGVANRRYFDRYFAREWRRAVRSSQTLSIIFADVDYFKAYNDHYGHQAGDDCLRKVAKALSTGVSRPADLLARYGGEEFVVVLPDTALDGACHIAENMRVAVESLAIPHAESATAAHITLSLGVAAVAPDREIPPESLIAAADKALYRAKKEGRNRVCVIPPRG